MPALAPLQIWQVASNACFEESVLPRHVARDQWDFHSVPGGVEHARDAIYSSLELLPGTLQRGSDCHPHLPGTEAAQSI